jgi:hypothetical protein
LNKLETEVDWDIRLIASAISGAILTTSILETPLIFFVLSTVSVITIFFILDFLILSIDEPVRTP